MHLRSQNKRIIIIGYSLGAAIGLKMLEYLPFVKLAYFFYGFPPIDNINPQKIACSTKVFIGKNDKVKNLSDQRVVKKAKDIYEKN